MTQQPTLRPLRQTDLDAVMTLEPQLFGADAWPRSSYEQELASETRYYLGAEHAGELIAYAGLLIASDAEIMTIGVAPQWRRRGLATRMLDALLTEARRRRCRNVFLEVRASDTGAQQLYTRAGFEPLGTRGGYYGPGQDALVMGLKLRGGLGFLGSG